MAEASEETVDHGRISVKVLQTRDGCANPGLGTMVHQDPRVFCKAEGEIFISVDGCIERSAEEPGTALGKLLNSILQFSPHRLNVPIES